MFFLSSLSFRSIYRTVSARDFASDATFDGKADTIVAAFPVHSQIELLDGWTGPLISNQSLFTWLDAIPIVSSSQLPDVCFSARLAD